MINQLRIDSVRNLSGISIEPRPPITLFYGDNGAGKTSILEAIHILGTGRSFRTHQINQVINQDKTSLQVYAALNSGDKLGVERTTENDYQIRINQETKQRLSILAEYLPVRVMNPESFMLLTSGAQNRRLFLDFCVFHVEHSFAKYSQTYTRLIKQRNALLKQNKPYTEFHYWDEQIVPLVSTINDLRQQTFFELIPYFSAYQNRFLPQYDVQYSLTKGVSDSDLNSQYIDSFNADSRYGYTTIGPHKADIKIRIKSEDAHLILSRGELKMMVACLILGQVKWLLDKGSPCYLLLDDLVSELDETKQTMIFEEVLKLENLQTFITAINKPEFFTIIDKELYQMFHVEHGVIAENRTD